MMNLKQLSEFVKRHQTHVDLLGDYVGPYSLGIGKSAGQLALVLHLEDNAGLELPPTITVGSEEVPLVVKHGFHVPSALTW
jgi:hypothetical protein